MPTIDWGTKVISVAQSEMTLVSGTSYTLDLDTFRRGLKDLEDDKEGIPFGDTHEHVAPFDLGSIVLARAVKLINGYTVTFEDGQYSVDLIGANSNVKENTNRNQVSVGSDNSAGLSQPSDLGGIR